MHQEAGKKTRERAASEPSPRTEGGRPEAAPRPPAACSARAVGSSVAEPAGAQSHVSLLGPPSAWAGALSGACRHGCRHKGAELRMVLGPGGGCRGPRTPGGSQSPASERPLGLGMQAAQGLRLLWGWLQGDPSSGSVSTQGAQPASGGAHPGGARSMLSWAVHELRLPTDCELPVFGRAGRSPEGSERAGSALSRLRGGPSGAGCVNSSDHSQQASSRTASYMSPKCLCICFPWLGTGRSS